MHMEGNLVTLGLLREGVLSPLIILGVPLRCSTWGLQLISYDMQPVETHSAGKGIASSGVCIHITLAFIIII